MFSKSRSSEILISLAIFNPAATTALFQDPKRLDAVVGSYRPISLYNLCDRISVSASFAARRISASISPSATGAPWTRSSLNFESFICSPVIQQSLTHKAAYGTRYGPLSEHLSSQAYPFQNKDRTGILPALKPKNVMASRANGGDGGIRTLETLLGVCSFSKRVPSASRPRLPRPSYAGQQPPMQVAGVSEFLPTPERPARAAARPPCGRCA